MAFRSSHVLMVFKRRTAGVLRTRRAVKDNTEVPSFKEFMHRSKVIDQYREMMRTISLILDEQWKSQLQNDVRQGYTQYKSEQDSLAVQMALREVSPCFFVAIDSIIGLKVKLILMIFFSEIQGNQRLKQIQSIVGYHPRSKFKPRESDPDSWINTKSANDPRGRIGEEWPWNR